MQDEITEIMNSGWKKKWMIIIYVMILTKPLVINLSSYEKHLTILRVIFLKTTKVDPDIQLWR